MELGKKVKGVNANFTTIIKQGSISPTFFACIFGTNVVLAAFYQLHFAWRQNFVQKKTQKNGDEIDTRFSASRTILGLLVHCVDLKPEKPCVISNCVYWGQFHQHFMVSFYAQRSQKCKKNPVKSSVSFCALGILSS